MLIYDFYEIKKTILKYQNKLWLVLKSDAYSFGMETVLNIGLSCEIFDYAVIDIKEAIKLRKLNKDINILLLGRVYKDSIVLKKYNIISTLCNKDDYDFLVLNNLNYYCEINTTMNRFGIPLEDVKVNKNLIGIYTHIGSIDDDFEFIDNKLHKFAKMYNLSYHIGGGRIAKYVKTPVRIGMEMYKKVKRMYGYVIDKRYLKKGDYLGYDNGYIANENEIIGILDVGYRDGLRRTFNGYVFKNNKEYQVVGYVCMNHTFIKIDNDIAIGDRVEFFGNNKDISQFLEYNNMTYYESFFQIK